MTLFSVKYWIERLLCSRLRYFKTTSLPKTLTISNNDILLHPVSDIRPAPTESPQGGNAARIGG